MPCNKTQDKIMIPQETPHVLFLSFYDFASCLSNAYPEQLILVKLGSKADNTNNTRGVKIPYYITPDQL